MNPAIENTVPETPRAQKKQRTDAAVSAYGALCAFMLGVQIIIDATGRAAREAGNAMVFTALSPVVCALLLLALITRVRRRHDMQSLPAIYLAVWGRVFGSAACVMTSLVFLADVLCALAGLQALGHARLLPVQHADATFLPALAASAVVASLAGEGLERLAFLARRAIPVLLLALSVLLVWREEISNLFPLFGFRLSRTVQSAFFSSGAAACVLASGFSPIRLSNAAPIRAKSLLTSGCCAFVLLVLISLSTPQSAMRLPDAWPALLIHTGIRTQGSGLFHIAVVVLECFALLIALCGGILLSIRALEGLWGRTASCVCIFTLCMLGAGAIVLWGSDWVRVMMPFRFIPALLLPLLTLLNDLLRTRRSETV